MTLVERLRRSPCDDATRYEAADEIERLRAELAKLREENRFLLYGDSEGKHE